ncbi:MAG: hypothetical protein EP343_15950 [Deltaproteobacteria bacterium]|nr:MAG: hypothetical protein EP343_15950 [Deltaproteobacteria bacterium]
MLRKYHWTVLCCALALFAWQVGCSSPTPTNNTNTNSNTNTTNSNTNTNSVNNNTTGGCITDSECTSPGKPKCVSGTCSPECLNDGDCTDTAKPQCAGGVCTALPPECVDYKDCKDATKPTCNNGVCQPCTADVDCKNPAFPTCSNGECTPPAPGCKTDADCTNPRTPTCSGGVCVPATPVPCKSNADCSAQTPLCDTQTGTCLPAQCERDTDCTTPTLPLCKDYQCTAECSSNRDCPSARPQCSNGRCIAQSGCTSDAQCQTGSKPRYCDVSARECRDCIVDKHCQSTEFCDVQTFTCQLRPDACRSDADCKTASPKTPFCANNQCVQCKQSSDCPALYGCAGGVCSFVGCSSDTDCANDPKGNKFCISKRCVQCSKDADCGTGNFCDTTTYTCQKQTKCAKDADCKAPTPYCPPSVGICSQCGNSGHCKQDPNSKAQARCVGGNCVGCFQNTDCKLNYLCTNGTCVEGCTSKRDCDPNTKPICNTTLKKCVACEKDTDCSGNDVCDTKTYTCQFRCTANDAYDQGCARRGTARYCKASTRTCVVCINKPLRPGYPYDIGCNSQAPKCNEKANKCVACLADNDCTASANANSVKCDTTTNTCYDCTKNSDCKTGTVCNTKTRQCIRGCLTDNDCPRGKVCGDYNQCVDCSSKSPNCAVGLVCDKKANACVECLTDTDCSGGAKCDTGINKCLSATGRAQCLPCSKAGGQAECATGHACVNAPLGIGTQIIKRELVCLKKCSSDRDCGQGYTCCSNNNAYCNSRYFADLNGYCFPRYQSVSSQTEGRVSYKSCKAVMTQGKTCTVQNNVATCGNGPISYNGSSVQYGDGLCEATTKLCRIPCRNNTDCTSGTTCKCPSGYTLRGSYCYDSANQYAPQRCAP